MESYTREDALAFYRQLVRAQQRRADRRRRHRRRRAAAAGREVLRRDSGAAGARARSRVAGAAAGRGARRRARATRGCSSRRGSAPTWRRASPPARREHAYPLEVLAEILGGTSTSRLYRSLVIDQKLATSAGAFYRGSSLDLTTFRIYATPAAGRQPRRAGGGGRGRARAPEGGADHRRGGRARHAPSGRRGDLRPRQPEHGGAQLRRGARHRTHGRRRRGVARADRRGHRGAGQCRRRARVPARDARSPAALCRRRSRSRDLRRCRPPRPRRSTGER